MFEPLKKIWKNRKIQFDIVSGFVVIMLVTSTSILWYNYQSYTLDLTRFAHQLMGQIHKGVIEKTMHFLNQVKDADLLASLMISEPSDISDKNEKLIYYMMGVTSIFPQTSSIYAGTQSGNFLQVAKIRPGAAYRSQPSVKLPGDLKYSVRYIDRSTEKPTEIWQYLDANGVVRDHERISKILYDHRTRDWYIQADQQRKFVWSNVYIFALNKKPGITAADPLFAGIGNSPENGPFFGVVGADILISQLNAYLASANIGKGSRVFIVDSADGRLIAYPNLKSELPKSANTDGSIPFIHDLLNKAVVQAFDEYENTKEHDFEMVSGKTSYFVSFQNFPGNFGKPWLVGIIAPADLFLGAAKNTEYNIILISLLIFIVSFVLIIYFSRNISKPIVKLASQALKIRDFNLESVTEIKSNVYEINQLKDAMEAMRRSLQAFGKFVPKVVVKRLTQRSQTVRIGGKEREITLFFSDIQSFTTVSESYPADKLMDHLSEYFEVLTTIIQDNAGTVDKYIGDAIMAFWGAPLPDKDHPLHACTAALKCQKELLGLNRKWLAEGKPELYTRIGIHTGPAIVGNMGSSDRFNYTALGDNVNLASRLEGVNKMYHTNIIVSQEVFERVHKDCLLRPLDVVAVKGKEKGVFIYELVGLKKGDPDLFPSREQIEFTGKSAHGFQVYLERRWEEAIETFESIVKKFGDDPVSTMYIERCKEFKKNPPPEEWDGVVHLKTK